MAVVVLVPSLLVSSSNTSRIWFIRTYGEMEYRELLYRLARKSKLRYAITGTLCSTSFISLVGVSLLFLSPHPERNWGYWFAIGIISYAFVIALYGSLYFHRLFKMARQNVSPVDEAEA